MVVQVKGLTFRHEGRELLRDIRMGLASGEVVAVVGPNGAGKSTLLKHLASIIPPDKRQVWIDGRDIRDYKPAELARKQAYVPQGAAALPLTVLDTVLLGRKPHMQWTVTDRDLAVVSDIIAELKLEALASRQLDELSGGERQRALIARALAQQPDVLLLDEPTAALDIRHQLEVLELVRGLARRKEVLIVVVLHDLELASRYADRVFLLKDGAVAAAGTPLEVFTAGHLLDVYGVEAEIERSAYGLKITAVRPV
ncbi:ABC transporter ATP-binding protein [Paenibacillus puerhi]|uniref:ABC transporter ATP-binding protein n=1 Tax=Paenibacillus puerhi TaxID=2692622 RepID=UPI0013569062|nr:ABC transporter ATP-binding protein [Paenibacillus puerhi]